MSQAARTKRRHIAGQSRSIEAGGRFAVRLEPVIRKKPIGFVAIGGPEIPAHAFEPAPGDAGEAARVVGDDIDGMAAP